MPNTKRYKLISLVKKLIKLVVGLCVLLLLGIAIVIGNFWYNSTKVPLFHLMGINYSPSGEGVVVSDIQISDGEMIFGSAPRGEKKRRYLEESTFVYPERLSRERVGGEDLVNSSRRLASMSYKKIPEYIDVTWHMAMLTNCEYIFRNEKRGCDWHELPNVVHSQRIALRELVLDEYQALGKYNESRTLSVYYATVYLFFKDEKVTVKIVWNSTNPFI